MTQRLAIPQNQLRAICAAARKERCIAEVDIEGVTVRLTPELVEQNDQEGTADVDAAQKFDFHE